jgi:glycosyltransferase involved in cell wall biosynthesis
MRLLYVTNDEVRETFIKPEVAYFKRRGVELEVFSLRDRNRWPTSIRSVGKGLTMVSQVAGWLAREPHLKPPSAAKNLLGAWLAAALAKERVDAKYDMLLAFWATVPATVAMLLSTAWHVPFAFTAHRSDIYARQLLPPKVARSAFIRTISRRGAEVLGRLVPSSIKKTVVIPLGIDIPTWRPIPEAVGERRVLAVGSLVPVKGHELLLEALEDLLSANDLVRLDVVGSGPLLGKLRSRILGSPTLGDRVRLLGQLPHGRVLGMMTEGYSCLVHSSIANDRGLEEGIPVVVLEAAARGLPIVATTSGATGEFVDSVTGWPCAPNSAQALVEGIEGAVNSRDEARRRAQAARRLVETKWNVEATGLQVLDLLRATNGS